MGKAQMDEEVKASQERIAELERTQAERKRAGEAIPERRIWLSVAGMFVLLCILAWLNEILDLPHLLLGTPHTPINWREAVIETVLIASVGLFAVLRLIRDITKRKRTEEALKQYSERLEELVEERTADLKTTNEQLQMEITERVQAEESLRRERDLAEALEEAAAAVSSTLHLDEVLDNILEQVDRVVAGDASTVMLIENDIARVTRWRGDELPGEEIQPSRFDIPIARYPYLMKMEMRICSIFTL